MKLAAVIGWPIHHSRSPKLHTHWLKRYGIQGSYTALPIRPDDLAACLPILPKMGFTGCNLTIPHKEIVLPLLDEMDDAARAIGAVNTVTFQDGRILGTNTDVYGFYEYLRRSVPDFRADAGPIAVLGAGGASRAVLYGLAEAGAREIRVINRSKARADALIQHFQRPGLALHAVDDAGAQEALQGATLVVNATSLGMTGQPPHTLTLDGLAPGATVYDLVYSPLDTDLLIQARARGCRTVDGLGMLLYQAKPAFTRFFGTDPEVDDDLRAAVLA